VLSNDPEHLVGEGEGRVAEHRYDTQAGCWIFISGQVGVPIPPDKGSATFEREARTPSSASGIR
jgi:hypothetical protein